VKTVCSIVAGLAAAAAVAAACPPAPSCFEAGVDAFIEEDYKASGDAFEKAVAAEPDNADYHLWLGRAWGRKAERATGFAKIGALSLANRVREEFIRAIELDSLNLPALQSLFDYYINAPGIVGGGVDKAEAMIERISGVDQGAGLRARAAVYEANNDLKAAEIALREAIRIDPEDLGHKLSLASFLSRQGRFEESDQIFAAAPDTPEVWYARAKAWVRAHRNDAEARRLLERYLETPLHAPDAEPYSNARKLLKEI
jgi:tetratricopeptide (TPR) repeat protein